jgi:hypothetical protein
MRVSRMRERLRLRRTTVWLLTRNMVGILLVGAACLKAHELMTVPAVRGGGILESRGVLLTVLEGELLLGSWLLFGVIPDLSRVLALIFFLGFTGVTGFRTLTGGDRCGCLGQVPVKSWQMLVVDVVAVAALMRWRPGRRSRRARGLRATFVTATCLVMGLGLAVPILRFVPGTLSADGALVGNNSVVVLEPEQWHKRPFPLLGHILIDQDLRVGAWIVVLFRMDCERCRKLIASLDTLEGENETGSRIAFLELPPYSSRQEVSRISEHSSHAYGRVKAEREWFVQTPAIVKMVEGRVTQVMSPAEVSGLMGE